MPDATAQRAVQALGITPRAALRQARRWARPVPLALSAAYYRDLARAQRRLNAQIRTQLATGADPGTLGPAVAAVIDRFADMIRSHGLAVLRWNARKYATPLGVALGLSGSFLAGVRTDALDPDLESRVLESWTRENVALIKGANAQQIERITALTLRAARDGTRAADVEREIANILGSAVKRARLIARDQIGKLGGQLDRLKQTSAGIEAYFWRTVGDERVRGLHRAHNGQRYTWDAPPSDGHPGQPIQCRCTAEPDLSGLLGEEFAMDVAPATGRLPQPPRANTSAEWRASWTRAEAEAMDAWLGKGYAAIRAVQRGAFDPTKAIFPEPIVREWAATLERMLRRAPQHTGEIYRGLSLTPAQARKFRAGAVYEENAIASFSTDREAAEGFLRDYHDDDTGRSSFALLKVRARNHPAAAVANDSGEQEVLVTRPRYRVVDVRKVDLRGKRGGVEVTLEEF